MPTPATLARSVARLTDASVTPGTNRRASSTRRTHEAQVIPSTPISLCSGATPYPDALTAAARLAGSKSGPTRSDSVSRARLTVASATPGTSRAAVAARRTHEAHVIPSTDTVIGRTDVDVSTGRTCAL